jgi:hypothetical protein
MGAVLPVRTQSADREGAPMSWQALAWRVNRDDAEADNRMSDIQTWQPSWREPTNRVSCLKTFSSIQKQKSDV